MENNRNKDRFDSDEFEALYEYRGTDLGASYGKDETQFKTWAPTATKVSLKLYSCGSKAQAEKDGTKDLCRVLDMEPGDRGTWNARVTGDLEGVYYTYDVTVDDVTRETEDPYAKACGVNGRRSMVVDLDRICPAGWAEDQRLAGQLGEPVIWEVHIKDFSYDPHSGVTPKWRGKYLAFTQKNTSLDGEGEFPTCVEYLKRIGVNYVHLLPTFDYGSVDESKEDENQFNWGYDPMNYNVPEGSYATDARDGHVRIREFREMVLALHQAGIGVIMDVVYNHTYHLDTAFQKMVPDYYYRQERDGTYSDGSACGNDTASERVMFRRYMADSVCYWAKEYHIDGFRFDLMGLHDIETMNEIRRRLDELPGGEHILMYGEPWSADKSAMKEGGIPAVADNIHLLHPRIAVFCDQIRDGVKGDTFLEYEKGYVNGDEKEALEFKPVIEQSILGSSTGRGKIRALAPSQIINYVSAHDDKTLWDKLLFTTVEEPDYEKKYDKLVQMNRMAAGIVFTCLGTPFFLAGEEFARTKKGNGNSFNLSPELNQLDWRRAKEYEELTDYYRFLIRVRKELPLLDHKDTDAPEKVCILPTEDAVLGFYLEETSKKHWKRAMVFYNPYDREEEISLIMGQWRLLSDGVSQHDPKGEEAVKDTYILQPKSVTIFASDTM